MVDWSIADFATDRLRRPPIVIEYRHAGPLPAALVLNRLFVPMMDPLAGTMAAFRHIGCRSLRTPIGGIILGHYGDKLGRKSMLVTTLMLIGIATVLIGLLPTHSQIEIAVPLLLVALCVVQAIGVGGEWGGAVLMAREHSHGGRRGFHARLVQADRLQPCDSDSPGATRPWSVFAVFANAKRPDGERKPFRYTFAVFSIG